MAKQAISNKRPKLALQLAGGLLQADPKSSYAHFIAAHARAQLGDVQGGLKSAQKAYRFAKTDDERFSVADLAARMTYAQKRPTHTQLWLRRAAQNAPTEQAEQQLAKDFSRVRRENPLSFHFAAGIKPSDNVNNGSTSEVSTVNGELVGRRVGKLLGLSNPLKGWVGHIQGGLSYRLKQNKKSQTLLKANIYISRFALSKKSAALLEKSQESLRADQKKDESDLGFTYASLGIDHNFAIGDTGYGSIGGEIGQMWSGGDRYYDFAKLKAARKWKVKSSGVLTLNASTEIRKIRGTSGRTDVIWGLGASYGFKLGNGDSAKLGLSLGKNDSKKLILADSESISVNGSYDFAKQMGPMKLSLALDLRMRDFDRYNINTESAEPTPRHDKSASASATMFFPDYDYMGFAPTITAKAGRQFSNYSRFNTKEFSVSLGFRSKF